MIETQRRNRRIVEMCRAGIAPMEVARQFKLSRERIRKVLLEAEANQKLAEQRRQFIAEVRRADDLDRPWPVDDLLNALRLIAMTRTALQNHWMEQGTDVVSLRQLMEMVHPSREATSNSDEFVPPPLFAIRTVGKKGFWSVVKGINELDLEGRSHQEWRQRLVFILRTWKGSVPRSWGGLDADALLATRFSVSLKIREKAISVLRKSACALPR